MPIVLALLLLTALLKAVEGYYRQKTAVTNMMIWIIQGRIIELRVESDKWRSIEDFELGHWDTDLPDITIWCDGEPLLPGRESGIAMFDKISANAINQGMYNGKNMEEGGWEAMLIDFYRVKFNCSMMDAEARLTEDMQLGLVPTLSKAGITHG